MRTRRCLVILGLALLGGGCTGGQPPEPVAQAAAQSAATVPFKPVATTLELMESVIGHGAEVYWEAVSIVVDENGITENFPRTDEEWEEVWAAAMGVAESGNLLMMEPRAVDDGEWLQWSRALVDRGVEAVAAAATKDPEQVLAAGEQLYYVCLGCHERYIEESP